MQRSIHKTLLWYLASFIVILSLILILFSEHLWMTSTASMPRILLWAWEAPQDLTAIDTQKIGVAELIATIMISQTGPIIHLRQQPLHIPQHTYRIAVIHMSAHSQEHPLLNTQTAEIISDAITRIYKLNDYQGLQIDFEATPTQRLFYKQLLILLRSKLGNKTIISITAIASWCTSDRWIHSSLPINFVVPMYFSLGINALQRQNFIDHFPHDIHQLAPACQTAVGLATNEKWQPPLRSNIPIFVFTSGSWHNDSLEIAKQLAERIQP